ncbi:MAG: NAD(P)-binding domain-containing protein, partial [Solirubrobacterales bacterium]|nr:NAD(P)-binding domain-containing protein [Solirubrobacterales bacterium]
ISPLFGDLEGLPPIHMQSAEEDTILSDAVRLEARAREAGVAIEHRRQGHLWHDFQSQAGLIGAADEAIDAAGEAISRCWHGSAEGPRVAIIGSGFGGIALALRLQRAGIEEFTIFERGTEVGGTWSVNTYPGAACDIPAHVYSLANEPNPDWSRAYVGQEEIHAYLKGIAERHGLLSHIRFGAEIARADFDEGAGLWRVETMMGETHEAEVLVSACGQLSRPSVPAIAGMESFGGAMFHSAEWAHDVDLTGKRVAVIGTGASAIQLVPELAELAGDLRVFQRSAPYVVPRMEFSYPAPVRWAFRKVPALRRLHRLFLWSVIEFFGLGFGRSQAPLWPLKRGHRKQLAEQVPDGALREALSPKDEIGCKRVLISNDYYPSFNRPNVELETTLIREIGEGGVVTIDGTEHPADAIIWGTGFKANEFLTPMRLFGRGGLELNEAWSEGARAYFGMTIADFPNLFLMYGPNTNQASGSIIHVLESQANYILDAVQALRRRGGGTIELRPEAGEEFEREMQSRLADSVWTGCQNWYVDERGRNSNNWPGISSEYRRRTRRLDPAHYVVTSPARVREPVA